MTRNAKIGLGIAGIGLAFGIGGYVYETKRAAQLNLSLAAVQVTLNPPAMSGIYPAGISTATVTWQNPSAQPVQYGVQGDIVVGGAVQGHFWTSLAVAQAALAAYRQGGPQALLPFEQAPSNRVAVLTVQPGQSGSVQLVASLTEATASPGTWSFMVMPGYRNGLLVADPLGTQASALAVSGLSRYALTIPAVS